MAQALNVQVYRHGQLLTQAQFDGAAQRTIKIGRLPSAQLKLDDPKVSRIHAVIELTGGEASLIDMGSTAGTTVNGAKVHKVKLSHGDEVVLGDTQILVGLGALIPEPVPPSSFVPRASIGETPRFDDEACLAAPPRRIGRAQLRAAAIECKPHPALPPEEPLHPDHCVLEMRLYWGEVLLDVQHYRAPACVTIGESKKTDVFLSSEGLPQEAFPLVRTVDGECVLTFTKDMEGELELDGQVHALAALRGSAVARRDDELEASYRVSLPTDSRALVHWGTATFALRFVPPSKRLPKAPFARLDVSYLNTLLASLFVHLALIVTFLVYPYDTEELRADLFDNPGRFASLILAPPKETPSTRDVLKKIQNAIDRKKQQQQLEEAPPQHNTKSLKLSRKRPTHPAPAMTPEQRAELVRRQFKKLLPGTGGAGQSGLLGGGAAGTLAGALADVIGTAGVGSASATMAGLNIRGGVETGGGLGTSRGLAGIGTRGRLGGGPFDYGAGVGLGEHKDVDIIPETPVLSGPLAKEVILRVIRQNQNQIRYCYEKQLQREQDLEGRVKVKWVIGASGDVVAVQLVDSSLHNAWVEACIVEKIRSWKFPAPAGGGRVDVVYPWLLKAS